MFRFENPEKLIEAFKKAGYIGNGNFLTKEIKGKGTVEVNIEGFNPKVTISFPFLKKSVSLYYINRFDGLNLYQVTKN